jgi:hypothetical protein
VSGSSDDTGDGDGGGGDDDIDDAGATPIAGWRGVVERSGLGAS